MRKTFVRTLAVTAILQFVITRRLAGQVLEEGRAERLWVLYPMNVLMNALAWTLFISLANGGMRIVRRP
jgi:hypothetical protein